MEEQVGVSLKFTQHGRFSTAISKTDTQGRGWRKGLMESRDLIWAHSPNPDLPSLSLFPWLHGGIMEKWFRVEWKIQKKQCSSVEHKPTTLTGLRK